MEPYRVGALADLISSSSKNEDGGKKKKSKKKDSLGDLFVSKLPAVPAPVKPANEEPKPAKKRMAGKTGTKTESDENELPAKKKAKKASTPASNDFSDDEAESKEFTKPSLKYQVRHEDSKDKIRDEEKEGRTVFVGNLPGTTTEKTLRKMFKEFGEVECVRFRGAARPDPKTTKRVSVIKRKFNEKHQRIIAYVRFKDVECAKKSCELNGQDLSGSVLRVDMATATPAERDQKLAVFIGNIPFSVEDDDVRKHFECCGEIASIRLVRDYATGMGKGFGYVNFVSADSVETAIQRNGTEFMGRPIRVGRSVRKPKATLNLAEKVKKGKLEKGVKKTVLVNKKVVKIGKKKQREANEMSFQGQTADGSASGGDAKATKMKKKKKNKGEVRKKKIAEKFAKKE